MIQDWAEPGEPEPLTVTVLTRQELRRALSLRSTAALTDALQLFERHGVLLTDGDRPERWVRRAGWDGRTDGKRRDRLLVLRGRWRALELARAYRALRYDEGEAPRRPQVGRLFAL